MTKRVRTNILKNKLYYIEEFEQSISNFNVTAKVVSFLGKFFDSCGNVYSYYLLDLQDNHVSLVIPESLDVTFDIRVGERYVFSDFIVCSKFGCDSSEPETDVSLVAREESSVFTENDVNCLNYAELVSRESVFGVRGRVSGVTCVNTFQSGVKSFITAISNEDGKEINCSVFGDDCERLHPLFNVGKEVIIINGHVSIIFSLKSICIHLDSSSYVVSI